MTIVIERVGEVTAALTAAGAVRIPTAVRKVTVEGAKPLKAAIKAEAPVGKRARPQQNDTPGNLKRSVRYKASKGFKGERYTIGAFGKGSSHRALVIYGHAIRGHQRSVGGFGKGRLGHKRVAGGAGMTRANSFVRRGGERAEGAATAALLGAATAAIKTVTL